MSIVIPTYNGSRFIAEALSSLLAQSHPPDQIVVVDNASTDGTADLVHEQFPDVVLLRRSVNGGFGAACNDGIRLALQNGADFVCLMNQDLTAAADCLEQLMRAILQEPECGLVSAFQLDYDGTSIDSVFLTYMPKKFWDELLLGSPRDLYTVDFMPAAAVAIRSQALRDAGGFDPLFFMYGEDNDLVRRIVACGWKIGVAPQARVMHWHGILNADRPWWWHMNLEYSSAVLYLKTSDRSLLAGFMCLFFKWCLQCLMARSVALVSHRIGALLKCLSNIIQIARHRRQAAVEFDSSVGSSTQRWPDQADAGEVRWKQESAAT